jgi:drug/metabolite transporter (DMT)-like permease
MDNKALTSSISKKKLVANLLLISTTVLWGSSFIITKTLTLSLPIFLYIGLRFSIAIVGFIPYALHFKRINLKIVVAGFITGFMYFVSMVFQTVGLQTTSAGKAAFITALGTMMVPFMQWIGFKKRVNIRIWIALPFSILGMGLLLLEGVSGIIIGDFLILACAVFYAIFVLYNDKYVHIMDVYLYSIFQLITISVFSFIASFALRERFDFISVNSSFWLIMIYMAIAVTTLTFLFQNWSQQYQGPSETAIIFTLEPVFAVLFASFILGHETMTLLGWLGCILIFIALIVAVVKRNNNKVKKVNKNLKKEC